MVRVVCQNFQPPRSRHNSGENTNCNSNFVDADLAQRAAEALTTGMSERKFESDTEISSDCQWDSDGGYSGDCGSAQDEGCIKAGKSEDVLKRRKERRRERNKMSAQAYRQRRKEQSMSQQKVLATLEEHQKELLQKIEQLESEKRQVEQFLRSCFQPQGVPYRVINTPQTMIPAVSQPQVVPEIMSVS